MLFIEEIPNAVLVICGRIRILSFDSFNSTPIKNRRDHWTPIANISSEAKIKSQTQIITIVNKYHQQTVTRNWKLKREASWHFCNNNKLSKCQRLHLIRFYSIFVDWLDKNIFGWQWNRILRTRHYIIYITLFCHVVKIRMQILFIFIPILPLKFAILNNSSSLFYLFLNNTMTIFLLYSFVWRGGQLQMILTFL